MCDVIYLIIESISLPVIYIYIYIYISIYTHICIYKFIFHVWTLKINNNSSLTLEEYEFFVENFYATGRHMSFISVTGENYIKLKNIKL